MFLQIINKLIMLPDKVKDKIATLNKEEQCVMGRDSVLFQGCTINNLAQDRSKIVMGNGVRCRGELTVYPYSGAITIGDDCYIGDGTRIWSEQAINIGDRVLIAHNVDIHDCNDHPVEADSRHNHYIDIIHGGFKSGYNLGGKPINICDDAWIGFGACVLKGVTIGARAVVAAHAVVTKDVPADTMVAGNPAKVIKKLIQSKGELHG